jgi:DNA-binding response OmpR family regulator
MAVHPNSGQPLGREHLKVLIVEDSAPTRDLLTRSLQDAGFDVTCASRFSTGLERGADGDLDAIVLDLMLPDGDGLTLCRNLRAMGVLTPILCLTARGEVADRVQGLDAGADDYLRKPFALAELQARVRALVRRGGARLAQVLESRDTKIDFAARRFRRDGEEIPLTAREWQVLEMLAASQGQMLERREILDRAWQEAGAAAAASLDVILSRLRRKLGGSPTGFVIRTLRGAGLVFEKRV